jgi:CRP-like cAMP-binding protein
MVMQALKTANPGSVGLHMQVSGPMSLPGFVMSFSRNEEIFGEEESAEFVYKVLSGAVRTLRILSDGRRQISAFHLPGDIFGIEMGALHRFSAEAVSDCQVVLVRRTHLERAAGQECKVARELWALAANDLVHAQDHMMLLGRKSASERVGAFLMEMAERAGGAASFDLPMSRTDIADYLGLTIETVSRTLTQMERDGAIALPSCRGVIVRKPDALAA